MTRGWTDTQRQQGRGLRPAELHAQTAIDTCAALTGNNLNFGKLGHRDDDDQPGALTGWGVRPNDWQWGVTVQQADHPARVAGRRLLAPLVQGRAGDRQHQPRARADYDSYTLTAPTDSRLPGGGGYPITLYMPTAAAAAIAAQNFITFETDFGDGAGRTTGTAWTSR